MVLLTAGAGLASVPEISAPIPVDPGSGEPAYANPSNSDLWMGGEGAAAKTGTAGMAATEKAAAWSDAVGAAMAVGQPTVTTQMSGLATAATPAAMASEHTGERPSVSPPCNRQSPISFKIPSLAT